MIRLLNINKLILSKNSPKKINKIQFLIKIKCRKILHNKNFNNPEPKSKRLKKK